MRIINISDTHSLHENLKYDLKSFININDENILIHSGDCTNMGTLSEITEFVEWYKDLEGFDKKIFIAGNHDFGFEYYKNKPYNPSHPPHIFEILNEENLRDKDVVYLEDSEYIFHSESLNNDIKFYGSPWQPFFYNWAFNLPINGPELYEKWGNIPDDTDILITHGPPYSILDKTPDNREVGCEILRLRLMDFRPLIHNFGHIHHSNGIKYVDGTYFVNSSICNEKYQPINKPKVLDLTLDINNKVNINIVE